MKIGGMPKVGAGFNVMLKRSLAFLAVFFLFIEIPFAQQTEDRARVLVLQFENETGDPQNDLICRSITDTIVITLRLFKKYAVLPTEERPESLNVPSLSALSRKYRADDIIFGSSTIDRENRFVFKLSVFDRFENRTTITIEEISESILGTFEAADNLVTGVLERFSDMHIGWGTLILENRGDERTFEIYINWEFIGVHRREPLCSL